MIIGDITTDNKKSLKDIKKDFKHNSMSSGYDDTGKYNTETKEEFTFCDIDDSICSIQ